MPFTFDLTMTAAGWNACEAAMTAQISRNPGTNAVSYLYGQESATGRWVRIKKTQSTDITERWHNAVPWQGHNPTGGHRSSFDQANFILPHPAPDADTYNNYLQWCCFFWQLTRLSGQPHVHAPAQNAPHHANYTDGEAAHRTRFGPPTPEFHDCETVRNALPATYFAPVFKIVVFVASEIALNANLPCAIGNLRRTVHVNVRAKCVHRLGQHPAGDPLPA